MFIDCSALQRSEMYGVKNSSFATLRSAGAPKAQLVAMPIKHLAPPEPGHRSTPEAIPLRISFN